MDSLPMTDSRRSEHLRGQSLPGGERQSDAVTFVPTPGTVSGHGRACGDAGLYAARRSVSPESSGARPFDGEAARVARLKPLAAFPKGRMTMASRGTRWPAGMIAVGLLVSAGLASLVMSAGAAGATETFAMDDFSRNLTDTWGTANVGGAYAVSAKDTSFVVDGSSGVMQFNKSNAMASAVLPGVSAKNVDLSFRFKIGGALDAQGVTIAAVTRRVDAQSEYRGRVNVSTAGSVAIQLLRVVGGTQHTLTARLTLPGVHPSATGYFQVRMDAVGVSPTAVRMKVWKAGGAEPTWQVTAHDSTQKLAQAGDVRLRASGPRSSTALPSSVHFDTLRVSSASRPKPKPTPTPTPTPTPILGITVPTSIDATCGSSVGSALNSWIAALADGSTLIFPAGSCYKLGGDAGLDLSNRHHLTLIGTGSTLQQRTTGVSNFSSVFLLQNSSYVTIRGFSVDGGNAATGTTAAAAAVDEHKNGAAIRGGTSFIEFDHVSWDRLYGFGIFISDDGNLGHWPSDISIHDSVVRGGEMGIAILAGRRINIVRNAINDSVSTAIDLEPDQPNQGFQNVRISDNDLTGYSWGQTYTSWFVAACPADAVLGTTTVDGLTITGNRIHIGAATTNNGNADGLGGLGIRADKSNLKTNVTITDNWTIDDDTQPTGRAVIYLANVQNLTVTGNRQPIVNGASFLHDTGTTGTRTVSGNNTSP